MSNTIDLDRVQPLVDLFNNIDFPLLRDQKKQLLLAIRYVPTTMTTGPDGIIHLLDALQDAAVEAGVPEELVFGK